MYDLTGRFLDPHGSAPHLKGKTAILRRCVKPGRVLAQFDDITLMESHGWWRGPGTVANERDQRFALINEASEQPWQTFTEIQFRIDDPNEPDETDERS